MSRRLVERTIPASRALLGVQAPSALTWPTTFQAIKDLGATTVRNTGPAWSACEDYASGAFTLAPSYVAGLQACAALGLRVELVAAFGPPWSQIGALTVGTGAGPGGVVQAGSTVIPVSGSVLSAIDFPNCFVRSSTGFPFKIIAYYGTLILSSDVAAGSITTAAPTNVDLAPGTTLLVNRLRYPPINGLTDTAASANVAAYVRYARQLALWMDQYGVQGHVDLWNEIPWGHDQWHNMARFYSGATAFYAGLGGPAPPVGMSANDGGQWLQAGALQQTLPPGIRFNNGCSDKSSSSSVLSNNSPTAAQIQASVASDGLHPYCAFAPEGNAWDLADPIPGTYRTQTPNAVGNFSNMARSNDTFGLANGGIKPYLIASECGTGMPASPTVLQYRRASTHLLRRILSLWQCEVRVGIYDFAETDAEAIATNTAGVITLLPHGQAVKRLMGLVRAVGDAGLGAGSALPSLIATPDGVLGANVLNIYGAKGALMVGWVRDTAVTDYVAGGPINADQRMVTFGVPPGCAISQCVNLTDGSTITPTGLGGQYQITLTVEPTAVLVAHQ